MWALVFVGGTRSRRNPRVHPRDGGNLHGVQSLSLVPSRRILHAGVKVEEHLNLESPSNWLALGIVSSSSEISKSVISTG
ncbi:unnamed protein product [Musa acuminata subsp. malaccensis]|uniref:(wild Malaysian banana) hypothetical protein n=1 Tax=Musa acuminata subsp. malaccensis TaxID=214687 RepID=A0A804KE25_MUSAM|nr:unnamed protein product [Musa acuminata subsp. malaccensis]